MSYLPKIVIPSRGRANKVLTKKIVDGAILVVSEAQAEAYRKHNPDIEIVTHSEELEVKNPTLKWKWMQETFGHIFLLDDDLDRVVRLHAAPREKPDKITDPKVATELIYNCADIAAQMGAYLYGFSTQGDPRNYHGLKPFRMTGMLWASGCGIREDSKLWYNPDVFYHTDFWMVLLNAYHHRFCFIDERFCFTGPGTFTSTGGSAEQRGGKILEEEYWKLKRFFGDAIKLKQDMPRAKRKSEWQPTLNLKF